MPSKNRGSHTSVILLLPVRAILTRSLTITVLSGQKTPPLADANRRGRNREEASANPGGYYCEFFVSRGFLKLTEGDEEGGVFK